MERQTAADFDQELLDIYDEYVHGQTDRRGHRSGRQGSRVPLEREREEFSNRGRGSALTAAWRNSSVCC